MTPRARAVLAAILCALPGSAQAQPAPSPRNANYTIDVRLDPAARTLTGTQTLVWTNVTDVPTAELRFHLYYNAWRNEDSTWMRQSRLTWWDSRRAVLREGEYSALDVSHIALAGETRVDLTDRLEFIAPDDGNEHDRTVMRVGLPAPVPPGATITLDMAFRATIPRPVARTGALGQYFFLAQWFPKIGVLDPDGTWNCHQFHATTEFFADFGVYDVRMTVPQGWPLAATGRERERIDNADGTTTHRYYQEDVHDFAWTTSPDYLERRARFDHPGLPAVDLRLMLQPEHASQAERHFEAARAALRLFGEWFGPYPYGHLTIVDPAWRSATGGMEYPTMFTAGTRWLMPRQDVDLEDVTIHEAGHQWWYGVVATNEVEDAWMDEGINQYASARAMAETFAHGRYVARYFGGFIPWVLHDVPWERTVHGDVLSGYRAQPTVDIQATPSYQYWPTGTGAMSYFKTSLWLHTIERALGWSTMQRVLRTFFERWQFRHPRPGDFFQTINEVTGRDLTAYVDQVYRSSVVFDYGVESVSSERLPDGTHASDIVIRRYGDGIFPVSIVAELANGELRRFTWDGAGRWHRVRVEHEHPARAAQIDPDQVLLLDTNFTNNSFATEPVNGTAARRWAAAWMVWLQDQLLTWALFV